MMEKGSFRLIYGLRSWIELIVVVIFTFMLRYIFSISLVLDFVLFTLLVYGYDLMGGHMKYRSLGHTLYFGIGLYAVGLFWLYIAKDYLFAFFFAIFASLIANAALSPIVVKRGGVYSVFINLALCLIFYWFIIEPFSPYTRGNDGIIFPIHPIFRNVEVTFYFLISVFSIFLIIYMKLINSPFGLMVRAIGENEERLKFLGYKVNRIKRICFIISATICAFVGALRATVFGYISPTMIYPLPYAAQILFASLLGGAGTFAGPFLGSLILVVLRNLVGLVMPGLWEIILGAVVAAVLFVKPAGLYIMITDIAKVLRRRI